MATTVPAGGQLSVAVTDQLPISGWDPLIAPDSTVRTLGPLVMATLLRPANDGAAPEPGLAESVTSDATATTWTLTLRTGLNFADGTALTATDMAFALTQAAKEPQLTGRFGADAKGSFFVSALASDPQTLVVKLRAPNATLDRSVFAAPEFGCVKASYGGLKRAAYYETPVSCGPYSASSLPRGSDQLVLTRNTSYYAPNAVGADRIVVTALPSADKATAFIADGGDVVLDPRTTGAAVASTPASAPTAEATTVAATSGSSTVGGTARVVESSAPGRVSVMVFRARPPTRDLNLRIAVQASLDVAALAKAQTGATAPVAGLVPPLWPGAQTRGVPAVDPTLAATATSLLASNARSLRLLVRAGNPEAVDQAAVIVSQLKLVGIKVRVDAVSTARYSSALASGSFQAALVTVAPRVALASDVTRQWAVSGGLGGGWSVDATTALYPTQISLPAFGATAQKAVSGFSAAVLDPVQALPLSARPQRLLAASAGLNGLAIRWDGSVPLERVAVGASFTP